jgi:hypothetical protein
MVKDADEQTMEKVFDKLYHNLDLVLKRIIRAKRCTEDDAKETAEYDNAKEKVNVIEALYEEGMSVEGMVTKLESIFNDTSKEGIILSTIHKSKGLEADRVFIIHPEKMPSKFARQEWELEQESNLRYVAYTRAKSVLGIVRDFDAYGDQAEETFADKVNEVIEPKHVGVIGQKYALEGTVTDVRYIASYDCHVFVIEDKEGNVFEKWGDIHPRYSTSQGDLVDEGSIIRARVTIGKHTEFKGVKKNSIKNFAKF